MRVFKSHFPQPAPVPDVNAHHILMRRPDQESWPDFTIHIDAETGRRTKYREFHTRVERLTTAMALPASQGGLNFPGDQSEILGIMMENHSDYITLVQAAIATATPIALVPSYSTPFELKHILTVSTATSLFVDAKFLPLVLPVAKEVGLDPRRIFVGVGSAPGRKSIDDLIGEVGRRSLPFIGVKPAKRDTLAYLMFSSGTTGLPKAVMISHGNIISALQQVKIIGEETDKIMKPRPLDTPEGIPVLLGYLPMHHTYGLTSYGFRASGAPTTIVIMRKWDINSAVKLIQQHKVSYLTMVPSAMQQLAYHPGLKEGALSSVTGLINGGAYLPPDLLAKFSKLMAKDATTQDGYGLSESTIGAIIQPFDGMFGGKINRIPGGLGILIPGAEARLVKEDGTDAEIGEPGEFWVRHRSVALGYWNNEKAHNETFVDGWLRTGDTFVANESGYFWFADRSKDTLKVSGSQVSPMEIENCLLAHPQKLITDATVAGVSGGRTSDEKIPRAWVVLSDAGKKLGPKATGDILQKWVQENLSKYKWLRGGVEVVNEIPKSPTGKVLRRVLRDNYEKTLKVSAKL